MEKLIRIFGLWQQQIKIVKILIVSLLLIVNGILIVSTAKAAPDQWETITPPDASSYAFNAIAAVGDYVYVGTNHGVYKSTDGGATWLAAQITSSNITSIAIGWGYDTDHYTFNPTLTKVYLGTQDSGVYVSTLAGATWTQMNDGLTDLNIKDLGIDQSDALMNGHITLYAGTACGVYRYDDSAASWVSADNGTWPGQGVKKLMTDFNGYVYALTDDNNIYSSGLYSMTGSLESWSLLRGGDGINVNDLTVDASAYYYLSTAANGIFLSNDLGSSWTEKNTGLNASDFNIKTLAGDYLNPNYAYAASSGGGVYKTLDQAGSWTQINKHLFDLNIKDIKTNPTIATAVYAVGANGIYKLDLTAPDVLPMATDATAPVQITDLTAVPLSGDSIALYWTAPSDPDGLGRASTYDIRYSLNDPALMSEADLALWWSNTASVASLGATIPSPQTAGSTENLAVSGIMANTKYYFGVKSADEVNNISILSVTAGILIIVDATAPTISSVASTTATSTATINWATDEAASSQIEYGLTAGYTASTTLDAVLVTSHSVSVNNLAASTAYHFRVRAKDAAGNERVSDDYTFKTLAPETDNAAPVLSGGSPLGALAAGTTQTALSVDTDEAAACKYATSANSVYDDMSNVFATTGGKVHTTAVSGLTNGQSYNYYVRCQDTADNANSADYLISFNIANHSSGGGGCGGGCGGGGYSPPADTTAPAIPTNFKGDISGTNFSLSWTNPTDIDFSGVVITRKANSAPATRSDGVKIYDGRDSKAVDHTVEIGKIYYYAISAYDQNLNYSASSTILLSWSDKSKSKNNPASGKVLAGKIYNNLAAMPAEITEQVSSEEADIIFSNNRFIKLDKISVWLYDKLIYQNLSDQARYAMAYFIQLGAPTVERLGAGERAGVIASFKSAFGRLPQSELDWQDVIKIANGRWIGQQSRPAEASALTAFKKIYKRAPDEKNNKDSNAIMILAYGLRPADRNTDAEKSAIKTFKNIYGKNPASANDWDIMRAIAYSGTKR